MEKKGDLPKKKDENANTSTNTNTDITPKYKAASGWSTRTVKAWDTNTEKAKGWGTANAEKVKGWGSTNTEKAKGWGVSTTEKTKGWGAAKNEAENRWGGWRTNRNAGGGAPAQRPYGRAFNTFARTGYSRYASSALVTKVGEYSFRAPSHIYFSKPRIKESENLANYLTSPNQSHLIFLLNPVYDFDVFKYIPRLFTIVTNNGSYLFNIEFLKDTSSTIRNYLKENPEATKYELSCKDDYKIVGKLEQLYLGKIITIDNEESPFFKLITDQLSITSSLKLLRTITSRFQLNREIQPILSNLHSFLRNNFPKTFIIATKTKEYLCNPIGVHSSKVIHEFISKNPSSNRFEFDFEDESGEFQLICNFFNFNLVQLTTDNMNSAKTIAEDLQIDFIKGNIDSFIEDYENRIQTLDDNQSIVDSIDELFETLLKIKEVTVDAAKEKIINSIWCQTEEEVQELAAFFLKVIYVDFKLHPYLADLLEALNKDADDSNQLKVLVPFITKKLMPLLGRSNKYNSFIFNLCRKGFIQKEEIKKNLILVTKDIKFGQNNEQKSNGKTASRYSLRSNSSRCILPSTYSFFIPELYEIFDSNMNKLLLCFPDNIHQFIKSYYPEKIENFLKMRESGETDDLLVKSLRNDDIDTFQSIVTQKQMNLNSRFILSYDLFENMSSSEPSSYINYAAAYGSLKCFKYLLLNHANLDKSSFAYAIFGGNDEIIKIIDQKSSEIQEEDKNKKATSGFRSSSSSSNSSKIPDESIIVYAIIKHENDLFDWLLEHKFPKINENVKTVTNLLSISCDNGNSHAIMTIIDKGFDFMKHNISMCSLLIQKAATNGFYQLLCFLIIMMNKKLETCENSQLSSIFDLQTSFLFGNLSIFKLYYEKVKTMDLKEALIQVVGKGYDSIIEYIFDELIDKIIIDQDLIEKLLSSSLENQNCDQFNYLISKFDSIYSNPLLSFNYINLLSGSCYLGNVEISKRIVELIFEQVERNNDEISRIDFTLPFFNAASSESAELCQFLVDKEVYINYKQVSLQVNELSKMNNEILQIIAKNIDNDTKEIFASLYIKEVIENKNKSFIEYLLNEIKISNDNLLFLAVNTYDLDIVNLILNHNSDPLFVNKISNAGTALNVAVMNQNLPIVKRLLSVPGIDPSLDSNNTPLINAIFKLNIDIINALLDFYGPNINSQSKQFNIAFTKLLNKLSTAKSKRQTEDDIKLNTVLNRLIEIESIDLNCTDGKYSLLSYACENDQIDIVRTLIKHKNIDLNLRSPEDGSSPLLISIINKRTEISKILIEQERTNINQPSYSNETPLTAAVTLNSTELVEMIINDKRFDPIESNLNYAFYLADDKIAKILIAAKGLDVNYRKTIIDQQQGSAFPNKKQSSVKMINLNNKVISNCIQTPLLLAVKKSKMELIDLIINHSSFNPSKSMVNECLFIACDKQYSDVFTKLLKLANINIVDEFGCSLLENAVNSGLTSTVTEILNNESFNLNKNYFIKAFIRSFTSKFSTFEIIKELIEYDLKHEHYIDFKKELPDGRSYFTILSQNSLKIYQIVKFLIESGADPNQPDRSGLYPLEFAIKTSRLNFINALIDSGKIDYNKKLYKTQSSYLHVAASVSKSEIVSIFLKNKLIDINVTDSDGNTPLIIACKLLNDQVIKVLFNQDDLDYLHVNNDGEDALKVTKKLFIKQENSIEESNQFSKIEYRDVLIEIITHKGRTVMKKWSGFKKENMNENNAFKDEKSKENEKGDAEKENKEDNEKSSNENENDDHNKPENKEDHEKSNGENENKDNEKIGDEDENKEKSDDEDENKEKSDDEDENKEKSDDEDENKEKSDDEDENKEKSDDEDEKSKSSNEFTPKVGFIKAKQIPSTNKYKFGFKKSSTSDSKPSSSFGIRNFNQQNDTKPSFVLHKRDLSSTSNPPQSRFTKTTPNSPVEDQIVSAVCESLHLESVTPEQAKEISARLSMIAGIEKNQNSHQSENEEKKQQKRIEINLENVDEDENEVIRSKTNQLNRRRNQEIDLYNDYSSYQDQMFQSQWNQVMQLNNMRNAQFNMIMQQQQQMMGIFGNVNVSKSQSKKKKKKSHK